jgi:hypothetical protein
MEPIKKGASLCALGRYSHPVGLDLAIRQFKVPLAVSLQKMGEFKLQKGDFRVERTPLPFVHADGQKNIKMILRVRRGPDRRVT